MTPVLANTTPIGKGVICEPETFDPSYHEMQQAWIGSSPAQRGFLFKEDYVDTFTVKNSKGVLSLYKTAKWSNLNFWVDETSIRWEAPHEFEFSWHLNRKTLVLTRTPRWKSGPSFLSQCRVVSEAEFMVEMKKVVEAYKQLLLKLTEENKI